MDDTNKLCMAKRGFTLLELVVVIIIIGILAAIALPNFGPMRERTLDKEAIANLKLIQAAQKIYRMEYGFYYPYNATYTPANASKINEFLKLALPAGAQRKWDYNITLPQDGTGISIRNVAAGGRNWTLNITAESANCTGSCLP